MAVVKVSMYSRTNLHQTTVNQSSNYVAERVIYHALFISCYVTLMFFNCVLYLESMSVCITLKLPLSGRPLSGHVRLVYRAPLTRENAHARIQLHSLARAIDGQAVHWAHANPPIEAQEICSYSWKEERELQNGHSQRTIAEKYGVVKSMVGDIWKYRQKLEDYISSSETPL